METSPGIDPENLSEELDLPVDVSVIIVTYNSRKALEPCLDSLKKQTLFGRMEVIVVDNASEDGTQQLVRNRYPWIDLHDTSRNIGFSRGVNVGMRMARGKFFLILNPDTVLQEDTVEKLLSFIESRPDAGLVSPKLIYPDGRLQYSCRRFYNWKVLVLRRTFLGRIFRNSKSISHHLMLDYDHQAVRKVDWVIGACMLVRREAVETVGPLDERFFLYFEDVDWCYRMRQKEWGVYYYPDTVVIHAHARASAQSVINRSFAAHLASLVRYYEKWNFMFYFLKKYREVIKTGLFLLTDIIAFNAAFLSAFFLRTVLSDFFVKPVLPIEVFKQFLVYENLLFVFAYLVAGLYKIRRETSVVDELFAIGKAIVLASAFLMASTYLGQVRTYSRAVIVFLVPLTIMYSWLLRALIRRMHRRLLAQKVDLKRICIVGPLEQARRLETELVSDNSLGFEVVGILATEETSDARRGSSLGDLSQIGEIVDNYRVHELIFLPGAVADERIVDFVSMGRRRVIDITVLTDYSRLVIHKAAVTNLMERPVITYRRDTRYAFSRLAKRILDIAVGTLFLVASVPFFVVYFVYASLRGTAPFLRESRLGLGGKSFRMPMAGGGSSNGPSDIVNLPLFWLVVTGKLSLVGPYPFYSADEELLGEGTRFRFDFRPGLTGYWRVGKDHEITLEQLLAQDASYVTGWSFAEDIKILMMTSGNILTGRKRCLRLTTQSGNSV